MHEITDYLINVLKAQPETLIITPRVLIELIEQAQEARQVHLVNIQNS
jgi:hypothetical protein